MYFDIQMRPGQEFKRYRHLVEKFKLLQGPFHPINISGHKEVAHAVQIVSKPELRFLNLDRRQQIWRT